MVSIIMTIIIVILVLVMVLLKITVNESCLGPLAFLGWFYGKKNIFCSSFSFSAPAVAAAAALAAAAAAGHLEVAKLQTGSQTPKWASSLISIECILPTQDSFQRAILRDT